MGSRPVSELNYYVMYNIVTDLCSVADTLDSKDVDLSQMYDIVADLSLFVRRLHPLKQAE